MTGGGSAVRKRSVTIAGHTTSVSLEEPFWAALQTIAARRGRSVNALIAEVDAARATRDPSGTEGTGLGGTENLSSTLRVFVLRSYQTGELP